MCVCVCVCVCVCARLGEGKGGTTYRSAVRLSKDHLGKCMPADGKYTFLYILGPGHLEKWFNHLSNVNSRCLCSQCDIRTSDKIIFPFVKIH